MRTGEIIQLNPQTCRNKMFAGCFMVVDELKSWGAQGYTQALDENGEPGGQAYYRAQWEEMEITGGIAPFIINGTGECHD